LESFLWAAYLPVAKRSWKEHPGIQRKNADSINRRIHSPPF
jgi:hypothetical protein